MHKQITLTVLLLAFIAICGTISANAQSNLSGTYYYDKSIDEGQNTLRLIFELKSGNAAVYSNLQDGTETQRRFGTWTYNKKLNRITVIMPPIRDNPLMGQEVKLTFVFKVSKNKLILIKALPYKEGTGETYRKL